MKNKIYLILILIAMHSLSYGQTKQIRGFVLSKADSLPIPYVNIYSDEHKFGTVSNELGEYLLNYPDSIPTFNLTFSNLGYFTEIISNQSIADTVYLAESNIQLDEILIVNTKNDISYVLKKVYENIKTNYSNKRHLLKGFYRQTAFKTIDSSYLRIVEADIDIQEYGILKALDRDRIQINHFRKSDDKITKKWYMEVAEKISGKKNNLVWLKKKDFIKNFVKFKKYHSHYNNILDNYQFEFVEYQKQDKSLIAVYSYFPKRFENTNLKENEKSLLYVNMDDYAIIKVTSQILSGPLHAYRISGYDEYQYTKIGDYYYLNRAKDVSYLSGSGEDKEMQEDNLFVYQVFTDRDQYDKIKRKETLKINEDVYDSAVEIDAEFWDNYKMLSEIPLKQKLKSILQKNKDLNKQFLDNDKN